MTSVPTSLKEQLDKLKSLSIDPSSALKAIEEALTDEERERLLAQLSDLNDVVEKLQAMMDRRDAIVAACFQEIIQWTCDVLCYIDVPLNAANLNAIFSSAASAAMDKEEGWQHYRDKLAPEVIQRLAEQLTEDRGTLDG